MTTYLKGFNTNYDCDLHIFMPDEKIETPRDVAKFFSDEFLEREYGLFTLNDKDDYIVNCIYYTGATLVGYVTDYVNEGI